MKNLLFFLILLVGVAPLAAQTTTACMQCPLSQPPTPPKPYKEKKKKDSLRLSINQESNKIDDYNPLTPGSTERYTTTLMYEYTPESGHYSVGVLPVFTTAKTRFVSTPDVINYKGAGLLPFFSHMFSPSWQGLLQVGAYFDDYDVRYQQFGNSPTANVRLHTQGGTYFGAAYLTWIGPNEPLSGSIRGGWIHGVQHIGTGTDSTGTVVPGSSFLPGSYFEYGGPMLSGRIKYDFNDVVGVYGQAEVDYHVRSTPRANVYRSTTGRQRTRFLVGPGIHFHTFDGRVQIRLAYNFVSGFGFTREHDILLRVRVLIY